MKILAVSDVESPMLAAETKRLSGIDLIISCGDLNESYLSYLTTVYGAPLFFVRGNHDLAITPQVIIGENLHQRQVRYKGISLMGFEGSLAYTANAVQYSEFDMSWMVRSARFKALFLGRPDIIVTHAPPRGIHEGEDFCHRGFGAFTKLIERCHPKYFLHGHTHLNYQRNLPRVTIVGSTKVINVFGYYVFEI